MDDIIVVVIAEWIKFKTHHCNGAAAAAAAAACGYLETYRLSI